VWDYTPHVAPTAYLRVFQPLDGFQPDERAHWERYILGGGKPRSLLRRYRQRVTTGRLGLMAPVDGDHADVRTLDGEYYVCPWRTRLRILAGLLSFREAEPIELAEQFVPPAEVKKAAKELARLRRRNPSAVSFINESSWHVPIRWFVLFSDEERRLVERDDGGFRLSYVSTTGRAMRRVERAHPVLHRSDLGPIADLVLELHEWLGQFDTRSLLELDYAGLCDLLTWDEMDDDHSAREIHDALSALSSGEFSRSADLYQGVLVRWTEVRSREQFN